LWGWFSRAGVEVTAGVDVKPPSSPNPRSNSDSKPKLKSNGRSQNRGGRLDVKVSDDSPAAAEDVAPLLDKKREEKPMTGKPVLAEDHPLLALSRKIVEENSGGGKQTIPAPAPPASDSPSPDSNKKLEMSLANLENRLVKLTGLIETLAPAISIDGQSSLPKPAQELYRHLIDQDVEESLAKSTAAHIAEEIGEKGDVWAELQSYLTGKISAAAPVALDRKGDKPHVLMLVGPTGVGKTTTLAKISAQYRYNPNTKTRPKIAFITADLYRLAAVEQLQKYTEILGVELEVTYSPDEVRRALQKHQDAHLILFDTAGTCQRNLPQMSTLAAIVEACGPDEVHLVISTTTKYCDMVDIVEHFKEINPSRLLFTKIDESTTYGPIFNIVSKYKMPISYLTTGQNVPEDIERAQPERIAKLLLSKPIISRAIESDSADEAEKEKPVSAPSLTQPDSNDSSSDLSSKDDAASLTAIAAEPARDKKEQELCNEITNF
ncbi:MAG: hypothetical protein ACP5I1_08400, partial [Candidatus Hinthialibacter sp.]